MTLMHITHQGHSWAATMELDELLRFQSSLLLPLFCVVFEEFYVKKAGGGVTPPGKLQLSNRFDFFSYWVCPSIWPSFTEIGEMACTAVSPLPGPLVDMLLTFLHEQYI